MHVCRLSLVAREELSVGVRTFNLGLFVLMCNAERSSTLYGRGIPLCECNAVHRILHGDNNVDPETHFAMCAGIATARAMVCVNLLIFSCG